MRCAELPHTREQPIVYRDLKPSNIMLRPNGEITLIDFGTAREFKIENIEDTTSLGTPGYAAPEQYGSQNHKGKARPQSDIYCLGATLHHLITGRESGRNRRFIFCRSRSAGQHFWRRRRENSAMNCSDLR